VISLTGTGTNFGVLYRLHQGMLTLSWAGTERNCNELKFNFSDGLFNDAFYI
jgi:hypothetical protein